MSGEPRTHRLLFSDLGRAVPGRDGETIFDAARRGGVRIVGACGGRGTCGSCMVRVAQGDIEEHAHEDLSQHHRWRRACRAKARGDCVVEIAPRSLAPVVRAEVGHDGDQALEHDSRVVAVDVQVAPPSLDDPGPDLERVTRALGRPVVGIDIDALRQLPAVLRENDWRARLRLVDDRVIGVAAPTPASCRAGLGLAVDLGTTNVAGFLVDLETGTRLAALGIENPQSGWGADVISRINHAAQHGADDLHRAIVAALDGLAFDLCRAVGADCRDIVDMVVCGNTAMHHLLAGLPVHQLGRAPFVAAACAGMDLRAAELGLAICPGAPVHLVANIGGFVGGDHVATLLATEDRWGDAPCVVMDIGTNTEISLIAGGRILSASCPSGPALEGGHISCGMRAADGAIERVNVVDGRLSIRAIGRKKPVGLCGSGVLDAVAALARAGMMDFGGRLKEGHPDMGREGGHRFALLAPEVRFTQHDIRAVQLAKAAIRTGTDLLLRRAGVQADEVGQFIIAGGFGSYVDVASGVEIGLFPALPPERFVQVGNAAGLGVCRMLTSRRAFRRAARLASAAEYVELSTIPDFQKNFLANIGFPRRARNAS